MIARYFSELGDRFGRGWNRFWFEPSDPLTLSVLRILVGLLALWYHLSYTTNLIDWFGPSGLLAIDVTREFLPGWHPSHMFLTDSPSLLWTVHWLGVIVLLALVVGAFTRVSSILSFLLVLSYVNRAAMVSGQFEPVLTMMLLYLCIGPAGAYLSVDSLLRKRRDAAASPADKSECQNSSLTTLATRLMQVHIAAFYLLAGLTKLVGPTWWGGEAVWWLAAQTETRLIDVTWLARSADPFGPGYVMNAWTHGIVLFELAFPVLVWNRLARPILLAIAVLMWGSLALITGLVGYSAIMFVASLSFVTPQAMCHLGDRFTRRASDAEHEPVSKKVRVPAGK
jgi:hypothetical protein